MTVFKSGMIFMFVLIEQSTQFSISSEMNSELPPLTTSISSATSSNQSGCLKTIGQCLRLMPNDLTTCAFEHAVNNIECLIASNATWHLNEFVSLKKNDDWKPSMEIEARQDQTLFETMLSKLGDFVASRTIQFSMPQDELPAEGRVKSAVSGFDFSGLTNYVGSKFGTGIGPGKKQSDFRKPLHFIRFSIFIPAINTDEQQHNPF